MSLGAVSRALGINDATLRQWADRGRLPVYRTPGGHRRFLREDVEALLRERSNGSGAIVPHGDDPEAPVLRRIRRKLSQIDLSQQSWMESFQAEGRDRMRLFGRRLLSLLLQSRLNGNSRRRGENPLGNSHARPRIRLRDGRPRRPPYRQRSGIPVLPAGGGRDRSA